VAPRGCKEVQFELNCQLFDVRGSMGCADTADEENSVIVWDLVLEMSQIVRKHNVVHDESFTQPDSE
jgi:hypothetical protein